jgi:hypothetical protein
VLARAESRVDGLVTPIMKRTFWCWLCKMQCEGVGGNFVKKNYGRTVRISGTEFDIDRSFHTLLVYCIYHINSRIHFV